MAEQHQQDSLHFLDYWRVIVSRKEIVIAVALLVILAGVLVTFSMSKVYMASCVIKVEEERPDLPVFTQEMMRFDPLFLRTQFEIIQSGPVVEEVVLRLNLNETLGRAYGYYDTLGENSLEQTYKLVSGRMKVQQYRDTNLIEIQIYMDEPKGMAPQMAADIANEVATVYRDLTIRRTRDTTERALEALHESLKDQRDVATKAEQAVSKILQKHKLTIVNFYAGGDSELTKMSVTQLEQARIRLRMEMEAQKALYEKVKQLSMEDLLGAFPYLVPDAGLIKLVAEKREAEVELGRMRDALGEKHPDLIRVRATIDELKITIDDALDGLRTGVEAEYERAKAQNRALEEMLEATKASDRVQEGEGYLEYEVAKADLEHQRRVLEALELRYAQERIEMRIPRTSVERVEPAKAPSERDQVRPRPVLNIVLSVLVGLAAGVGLAYFVEYLDTSIKTIDDIEQYMQTTVLGVIPQKVKPLIEPNAEGAHSEAYRVLRTNVRFSKNAVGGKSVCVTSASVGEGKSLTLFNLAYISAQLGDRVIIVDSDLHRPRQHKIVGTTNRPGLANILVGDSELDDCIQKTSEPKLDLLPSGKLATGVHGLISTDRMRELVTELKERYDFVFFDSPPIIGVSDASLLTREVDGVLLVIQHRKYPRALSARAKEMVENFGGNLLGVVLNNINISRDYAYYYYHQHYYYYPHRDEKSGEQEVEASEVKQA
ncbi:MAG: polysaccharide biosynthesis tyrosine autokinase [Kiritimatiellae bacterium]|nr:polysaccharide biosynthesis tyrosine autokinase [Kiritimatiellia bacterium]